MTGHDLMTAREAAGVLRISVRGFWRFANARLFPDVRIGHRRFWHRADLLAWIDRQRTT